MKLYQFETHCHTSETSPCGVLSGAEVADGLKAAGYMGTFITDHFNERFFERGKIDGLPWPEKVNRYLKGYNAAKQRGDEIGVKVLLGMEVQVNDSPFEFVVYGAEEQDLLRLGPFYRLSTPAFYGLMRENGFLVFQAHPYRYGLSPENPAYYDGIEIVNSQPRADNRNRLSLEFAARNHIYKIAGSDVHLPEDIGRSGVMVPGSVETGRDFTAYYNDVAAPELIVTYGS